jgi:hypothetical protein
MNVLMTNSQFYFSLSVPLVGILVNVALLMMVSNRISSLETILTGRIARLEDRVHVGHDLLIGKVGEIDSRLAKLEERLAR